jgi:hypothetical protein
MAYPDADINRLEGGPKFFISGWRRESREGQSVSRKSIAARSRYYLKFAFRLITVERNQQQKSVPVHGGGGLFCWHAGF